MDTIDRAFTTASMDDEHFCFPIKVALELGKHIMNKYYNLTDESEIYRSSISMPSLLSPCIWLIHFVVLHPGLKTNYFRENRWQQSWQDEAIAITRRIFDEEYQDSGVSDDTPSSFVDATQVQQSGKVSKNCVLYSATDHWYRPTPSVQQCVLK